MAVVKLCGLRSEEDAVLMNEVQPDYVGFVFAPGKHQISAATAIRLSSILKYSRLVGVFVNEQPDVIAQIAKQTGLDVIQLHGDESDKDIEQLKKSCRCEIWKAVRIHQLEDMDAAWFPHADRLLVDSYVQGLRGGSGKRIAMDVLQKLDVSRLIIAGGIGMDTVEEILALQPYGIDVSTALETDGRKDKEKVRLFMKQIKEIRKAQECAL